MIFFNFRKRKNEQYEEKLKLLISQVELAIKNTNYIVSKIDINELIFGNTIVELSSSNLNVRFVQDRGDIYCDTKTNNSEQWIKWLQWSNYEKTLKSEEGCNDNYKLLLSAIYIFLGKQLK